MQALRALAAAVLVLMVITIGVVSAQSTDGPDPIQRNVVADLGQRDMLEADGAMLDRMRASNSPGMNTMIGNDPMWTNPDMVRLQESYQAQVDRMLGNRSATP